MNFRLIVRPQAELEILEAAEYYEGEKDGLGLEFLDALEAAMTSLAGHPQFYFNTAPEKAQRRFLLSRFPYLIIYEIRDDEVIVLAVRHAKQKPFG